MNASMSLFITIIYLSNFMTLYLQNIYVYIYKYIYLYCVVFCVCKALTPYVYNT